MKKVLLAVLFSVLMPATGFAADAWKADVEVDPTAYALAGYSLHAGIAKANYRVDLGAFAMAMPEALHGQDDFEVGFHGFGAKLQYFFREQQDSGFVGVGVGVNRVRVTEHASRVSKERAQVGAGIQGGWRFSLPADFYLTPWLGIDYALNAEDFVVNGKTFENNPLSFFPAIHVGYRF